MKKVVFILAIAVITSVNSFAQEINWVTLEKAIELQKKNPKKIMMDVYTNWCGPCKMLDKNTFQNPDVANYVNANYYAVKFNAEGNEKINYKGKTFSNPSYNPEMASRRNSSHQLSQYFQITGYPTIVFLDEKATFLTPVVGYKTPPELEFYLKLFKTDDYKSLDTQDKRDAYYTAFKPEFKG
ncbi:thioredoxin family protein [Mariniflexile sp.]|uniref:thioredoxin family protein n=1 Tax=Mariniflexile sp. TaxID=1979402 RepID=UPI004047A566